MKQFDEAFKTKLYETIEDIENNSLVEVVAIIRSQSSYYKDISLWAAFLLMAVLYTFFMFAPIDFNVYLIYFFTVLSFPAMYVLTESFQNIKRPFINKKTANRKVEIYSRAVFQKGGVRHTQEKIGVLFYVSLLEKQVRVIPDRGAETMVPKEEWDKINAEFSGIFAEENKANAFLNTLAGCKAVFSEYIPPVENDINELPDNLEVEF